MVSSVLFFKFYVFYKINWNKMKLKINEKSLEMREMYNSNNFVI